VIVIMMMVMVLILMVVVTIRVPVAPAVRVIAVIVAVTPVITVVCRSRGSRKEDAQTNHGGSSEGGYSHTEHGPGGSLLCVSNKCGRRTSLL
jgi:hypothetical protein